MIQSSTSCEVRQWPSSCFTRTELWRRQQIERKQTRSRHKLLHTEANKADHCDMLPAVDLLECQEFACTRRLTEVGPSIASQNGAVRTRSKLCSRRRSDSEREEELEDVRHSLGTKTAEADRPPPTKSLIDVFRAQATSPILQSAAPVDDDAGDDKVARIGRWPVATGKESYQVKEWHTSPSLHRITLTAGSPPPPPPSHVKFSNCLAGHVVVLNAIEVGDCSIVDCSQQLASFDVDCNSAPRQARLHHYVKVPTTNGSGSKDCKRIDRRFRDGQPLSRLQQLQSSFCPPEGNRYCHQQQQHLHRLDLRRWRTIAGSNKCRQSSSPLPAFTQSSLAHHRRTDYHRNADYFSSTPPPSVSARVQLITKLNVSHELICHRRAATRLPLLLLLAAILISVSQIMTTTTPLLQQAAAAMASSSAGQQADPRPTIYSGQVSFGLLLSAHMPPGTELSVAAAASDRRETVVAAASTTNTTTTASNLHERTLRAANRSSTRELYDLSPEASSTQDDDGDDGDDEEKEDDADQRVDVVAESPSTIANRKLRKLRNHERRQIFERPNQYQVRRQQQQQQQQQKAIAATKQLTTSSTDTGCGEVNPNALYAGMGAIWASHQANLVGDSQLAIGTYVYDSCNDLDVGQRQSVRIVSNLNAFQQTTCESPRGSPISLTIAHGDNQLRAIQLLTSFRVPVVTTKEPFALEDYHLLSREQRRFLFSTAPSSRHLAVGALKFTKRVVSRSTASAKLPNQFHKMSSKNGLIVISRNLPAKFIAYLTETIPNHVNYEMLQSNQPIDQVRSVEVLESILTNYHRGSSSQLSSGSASESRLVPVVSESHSGPGVSDEISASRLDTRQTSPTKKRPRRRRRRYTGTADDSDTATGSADSDSTDDQQQQQHQRMLSPTILMFITPSEAIDLITRLRNDLAEVSRYYSLIVTTREDISPALRTIFHRGGSRLCSGKAFYTISPKPDEVNEFSRYFRDTVQMEGESSDHPLVCEFAKHQATSKKNADLDDVSTESVIKAVWSAAAAFKLVHKRECGHLLTNGASGGGGNVYAATSGASDPGDSHHQHQRSSSAKQGRQSSAGGSGGPGNKSAHSECMVKMNKNMSGLVQRALKKLDVHINSTGLQALDGFRIKFDEMNELLTNKYSIKYINKECEITEIGQYSGSKESQLYLDDDTLVKSLESTLPDPWPLSSSPSSYSAGTTMLSGVSGSDSSSSSSSSSSSPASSVGSGDDSASSGGDSSSQADGPSSSSSSGGGDESSQSSSTKPTQGDEDQEPSGGTSGMDGDRLPSITLDSESPKKKRSNAKLNFKQQKQQFAMSSSSRGLMASDFDQQQQAAVTTTPTTTTTTTRRITTNGPSLYGGKFFEQTPVVPATTTTTVSKSPKSMRKMKPFPIDGAGVTLKDWLPRDETTTMAAATTTVTTTTRTPRTSTAQDSVGLAAAGGRELNETTIGSKVTRGQLELSTSTTRAPMYSTLPESGGNTDLDMPAFKGTATSTTSTTSSRPAVASSTHATTSQSATMSHSTNDSDTLSTSTNSATKGRSSLETAATSDSSDYVTLPSIVRHSTQEPDTRVSPPAIAKASEAELLQNASQSRHQYRSLAMDFLDRQPKLDYLRDLNTSPVPLVPAPPLMGADDTIRPLLDHLNQSTRGEQRSSSRSRFRSHLNWIYSSWFTMAILGANICGALLTLYVLTFLLMKNCDGSLDRENQGIRSIHLLSIIVVFFGSTLFIVYPTPGLCLLRSSWHNFALVLIFGTLLLQSMQTRSIGSIGLGGRPNRLNQFLTLVFMVGVQISFELQRWKYESANYVNFVNQYFSSMENGDKKFLVLASSMQGQFNPLNSFNDQVTPVSIQVSERYQNLLHDYCSQPIEDFLQSQIYLWIIIGLLVVFSISARRARAGGFITNKNKSKALASSMSSSASLTPTGGNNNKMTTGGQLLVRQHEANLLPDSTLGQQHDHSFAPFASNVLTGGSGKVVERHQAIGNIFLVTLISAPIYFVSVIFHVHGQNLINHDLVSSVTMILIAFTILIGTFLPVLRNVNRYDDPHLQPVAGHRRHQASLSQPINQLATRASRRGQQSSRLSVSSLSRRLYGKSDAMNNSSPSAFAMFPEFASTGLRRPSSIGGESGSHACGSRRPFADTKESRRQMGVSLANLPVPSADSLRSLCIYNHHNNNNSSSQDPATNHNPNRLSRTSEGGGFNGAQLSAGAGALDPGLLNLKLNLSADDEMTGQAVENDFYQASNRGQQHHNHHTRSHHKPSHHHHHHHKSSARLSSSGSCTNSGEKRLIMLDVDPSCPRHGMAAWSHRQSGSGGGGGGGGGGGSHCMDDGFGSGGPN